MLEVARLHGFAFDAVQLPLNVMDAHYRSFARLVVPELLKENIGVLGMKSMGNGIILMSGTVTADECLHYALNLTDFCRHHRYRQPRDPRSGVRGGTFVQADERCAAAGAPRENRECGITPGIRTLQDLFDIRCHVGQGLDGRRARTAATPDAGLIAVKAELRRTVCLREDVQTDPASSGQQ
jgi:hypothetical protein